MAYFPESITPADHVAPVPRRVRAYLGDQLALDTTSALYVWEWAAYPQFYVPLGDVRATLEPAGESSTGSRGTRRRHGVRLGTAWRPDSAWVYSASPSPGVTGTVHLDWDAFDSWFEEDEQVFVHPRNPYTRVDALRSTRTIRIEVDGVVLASSSSPVLVFETGLPTRYYLNRTDVDFSRLTPSDTETACPYKGVTSGYWSLGSQPDIAWTYDFPTRQLLPIAGLIAFYNEKVDTFVDDQLQPR